MLMEEEAQVWLKKRGQLGILPNSVLVWPICEYSRDLIKLWPPGVNGEAGEHDDEAGPRVEGGGQDRQGEEDLGEQDWKQCNGVGESGECVENGQKHGWANCATHAVIQTSQALCHSLCLSFFLAVKQKLWKCCYGKLKTSVKKASVSRAHQIDLAHFPSMQNNNHPKGLQLKWFIIHSM